MKKVIIQDRGAKREMDLKRTSFGVFPAKPSLYALPVSLYQVALNKLHFIRVIMSLLDGWEWNLMRIQ